MSIRSLLKEKPQKKSERLFQFFGILSILILAGSILGVAFTMFYHWYTPWQTDYLISWPELFTVVGLMFWQLINSIFIYIAFLLHDALFKHSLEFSLPFSIIANIIFLIILLLSIKFIITKKYQNLTIITKKISKIFIVLFIINLIITIIGIIEVFYFHFLR
jgi:hypothetical protein